MAESWNMSIDLIDDNKCRISVRGYCGGIKASFLVRFEDLKMAIYQLGL